MGYLGLTEYLEDLLRLWNYICFRASDFLVTSFTRQSRRTNVKICCRWFNSQEPGSDLTKDSLARNVKYKSEINVLQRERAQSVYF